MADQTIKCEINAALIAFNVHWAQCYIYYTTSRMKSIVATYLRAALQDDIPGGRDVADPVLTRLRVGLELELVA